MRGAPLNLTCCSTGKAGNSGKATAMYSPSHAVYGPVSRQSAGAACDEKAERDADTAAMPNMIDGRSMQAVACDPAQALSGAGVVMDVDAAAGQPTGA